MCLYLLADKLSSTIKARTRKLLIAFGAYKILMSEYIGKLFRSGKTVYNLDRHNNMEPEKKEIPSRGKESLHEWLKEKQQLLSASTRKEEKEKRAERNLP